MTSPMHQAALNYAAAGMPVFPCVSNANGKFMEPKQRKKPICDGGYKAATTDVDRINDWWEKWPDANIGFWPGGCGWGVIDVEARAIDDWYAYDVPDTFMVKTTSGGLHYYFRGDLPQNNRTLMSRVLGKDIAIDTRGVKGYVLLPPSVVNDSAYEVAHDVEVADLPAWIVDGVASATISVSEPEPAREVSGDAPLLRGRMHLLDCRRRGRVAVKGHGADSLCYAIATELRELGVEQDDCTRLMLDHWYEGCTPADKPEWVKTKVANAYRYGVQGLGSAHVDDGAKVFHQLAGDAAREAEAVKEKPSRFKLLSEAEMEVEEDLKWLIPNLVTAQSIAMMYGKSGSYKSYMLLDIGMSVAAGLPTIGGTPTEQGAVVFAALEGLREIKGTRRKAWRVARGVEGPLPFYVTRAPMLVFPEEAEEFRAQIQASGVKPKLIILETLSRMMVGLDPTKDAPRVVAFCDSLKEQFGCTVILSHHAGHDTSKGPRDSSVYFNDFDHVLLVSSPAKRWVEVMPTKHKSAELPDEPFVLEGVPTLGELVFQIAAKSDIPKEEDDERYSRADVGDAIRSLGGPVSTMVLAKTLKPALSNEDYEAHEKRLSGLVRDLNSRKKKDLHGFVMGDEWSVVS